MPATTSKDLGSALAVTLAGGAALFVALRLHWNPQDLNPGIEGCLTATVLGFVMALLHGLPYGRALGLCAPTAVAQYAVCAYAAGQATGMGITSIQLLVMGFVGMALALREPHPAVEARGAARPSPRRPVHSHT